MKGFASLLLIFGVMGYSIVEGLEDYDNFREGACSEIWSKSQSKSTRQQNIDVNWVDTLTYNSAGSKYHMYKMASPHPRYESMAEDEFYYDFCYRRNTSTTSPLAAATGFGRILELWDVRTRSDLPGVYIEATPRNYLPRSDVLRQRITLTDNKSFAFLLDCWTGSNQRGWNIVSNTPSLSPQAKRMIENHALALGFSKENFVFLRYDSCEADNPWARTGYVSSGEGSKVKGPRSSWKSLPIVKAKTTTTTTTTTKRTTPQPPLKRVTIPTKSPAKDNRSEEGSGWTK